MATKKRKPHPGAGGAFADEPTRTPAHAHRQDANARTVIAPFREERDTDQDERGNELSVDELSVAELDGFRELGAVTVTDLPALAALDGDEPLGAPGVEPRGSYDPVFNEIARSFPGPATAPTPGHGARGHGAGFSSAGAQEATVTEEAPERRLTATLLKIFSRRRQEIRLSLDQLTRLSGISLPLLESFEHPRPGQTISYDQVVVLARVLGLAADELPGLRRREARAPLEGTLAELERSLLAAPLLRFEGAHGERFGGDVERAAASKGFSVRIEDESLSPTFARGSLLGFLCAVPPRPGGVLLLRHRRSSSLAMRRLEAAAYVGVLPWQPSYVLGGEWHVCGALEVVLPPR